MKVAERLFLVNLVDDRVTFMAWSPGAPREQWPAVKFGTSPVALTLGHTETHLVATFVPAHDRWNPLTRLVRYTLPLNADPKTRPRRENLTFDGAFRFQVRGIDTLPGGELLLRGGTGETTLVVYPVTGSKPRRLTTYRLPGVQSQACMALTDGFFALIGRESLVLIHVEAGELPRVLQVLPTKPARSDKRRNRPWAFGSLNGVPTLVMTGRSFVAYELEGERLTPRPLPSYRGRARGVAISGGHLYLIAATPTHLHAPATPDDPWRECGTYHLLRLDSDERWEPVQGLKLELPDLAHQRYASIQGNAILVAPEERRVVTEQSEGLRGIESDGPVAAKLALGETAKGSLTRSSAQLITRNHNVVDWYETTLERGSYVITTKQQVEVYLRQPAPLKVDLQLRRGVHSSPSRRYLEVLERGVYLIGVCGDYPQRYAAYEIVVNPAE